MGYRSEVLCAVGFPTREELVQYMTFHKLKDYPSDTRVTLDEFISKAKFFEGDGYSIAFHQYSSIKWYENYEDIQIVLQFITGACAFMHNEADREAVGKILRIGEEQGDIESNVYGSNGYIEEPLEEYFYPVSYINVDIRQEEYEKLKTIGELNETK